MQSKVFWGTSKHSRFLIKTVRLGLEFDGLIWLKIAKLGLLMACVSRRVPGDTPAADLIQLFPEPVGAFQRIGRATPPLKPATTGAGVMLSGSAEYSKGRERFQVYIEQYGQ